MAQVLRQLKQVETTNDPNVLVGTDTLDDAGVYRLGDDLAIVQTVDFFAPLVDDPYLFGQIAAANALSDVYAMGGQPRTVLNIVGFPDDKLPMNILTKILEGGAERVREAGAVVIGGHSVRDAEIKFGLSVTGLVHPSAIIANSNAKAGDVLFLTKPLGTGFITTAYRKNRCPDALLQTACESMKTLNAAASEAMKKLGVRAATDVTGFGLAGHGNEMACGSGVTLAFELGRLPRFSGVEDLIQKKFYTRASETNRSFLSPQVKKEGKLDPVLEELLYDPQTSGGMLMAVPAESAPQAESVLAEAGVSVAARIGQVHPKDGEAHLILRP